MVRKSCIDLLLNRRSIRRFKPKDISDEVIQKIIDIARYAPSAKNSQPWEFIIVKDIELRENWPVFTQELPQYGMLQQLSWLCVTP